MTISYALQRESPRSDQIEPSCGKVPIWPWWPVTKPMKLRISPKLHGPLAILGFALIMAIVALIESIGGVN